MPKVFITKQDKLNNKLVAYIYGAMKVKKIPQRVMADELGISQPAFAKKLKNCQFTFTDLTTIFNVLDTQDEEILSVMRLSQL